MKIDGKQLAKSVKDELEKTIQNLKKQGITPSLSIITVGDEKTWKLYVNQKIKQGKQLNIRVKILNASDKNQTQIKNMVDRLNIDKSTNGIIIQRPVRYDIDEKDITDLINPQKDVDAFSKVSKFTSPIIQALEKILQTALNCTQEEIVEKLNDKKIVVIGKGPTGGKPVSEYLTQNKLEHTVVDSKTNNPEEVTKTADIIITAVGKKVINSSNIKPGVGLIGIGIHKSQDGTKGDYDQNEIKDITSFYTPTPGGVGPLNLAYLFKNVVQAAQDQQTETNAQ